MIVEFASVLIVIVYFTYRLLQHKDMKIDNSSSGFSPSMDNADANKKIFNGNLQHKKVGGN